MYMYLLGLAISNLCVLVTAIPALHDNSGGLNSDTYATAFYQAQLLLSFDSRYFEQATNNLDSGFL